MNWMCVTLTENEAARGGQGALQNAFARVWMAAGAPPDAVMYGGRSARDNRCFFTSAAVVVARPLLLSSGGVDCLEADTRNLIVLVKNEGAPARS